MDPQASVRQRDTEVMLVAFDEADSVGDRFLDLLRTLSIDPTRKTDLEDELLSLTELVEVWKQPDRAKLYKDAIGNLRFAAGIHDLAAKVLSATGTPDFGSFQKHLELLAGSKPFAKSFTVVAQNTTNDIRDDVARKISELYVACLAVHCGHDVVLDDPIESKGDNPDVMLTYEGKRWALAVKTIGSRQGQTVFDNIKSAVRQIDRSSADSGLVVVNVKNVLDHGRFWKLESPYPDLTNAIHDLNCDMQVLTEGIGRDRLESEWVELFAGKKAKLPIILLGQSLVALGNTASVIPCPTKIMTRYQPYECDGCEGSELAACLNHWMQSILKGNSSVPPC